MKEPEPPSLARLIGLLVAPVVIAIRGWALSLLWGWFMVPLGAPSLSVWHASGLVVLLWICLRQPPDLQKRDDDDKSSVFEDIFANVLLSGLVAGLGWIYHALM